MNQPVHLMMESQDVEYLVLDVSPCRIISTVPTSSTEVDRLGSSLPPDCGPTILLGRREAEHDNEKCLLKKSNNDSLEIVRIIR